MVPPQLRRPPVGSWALILLTLTPFFAAEVSEDNTTIPKKPRIVVKSTTGTKTQGPAEIPKSTTFTRRGRGGNEGGQFA